MRTNDNTPDNLTGSKCILAVTGGIAAYKAPELIRRLVAQGVEVRVVMTASAQNFVTPLTLQAVSGHKVYTNMFEDAKENSLLHIELARWADFILIAPLSANRIAAMSHGFCDDLMTTICLATKAPIYALPAMNTNMWQHKALVENLTRLESFGVEIWGPGVGIQACREVGPGRMLEVEEIVERLRLRFNRAQTSSDAKLLQGLEIMISAGPTVEAIDPVRYISNRSSGKMGYALALIASQMGAKVTLVSGPVKLSAPKDVKVIDVCSARQMYSSIMENYQGKDIFIGTAAVSDFRPANYSEHKIKRATNNYTLEFVSNEDIIANLSSQPKRPMLVGFAAETQNLLENAKQKLKSKGLDMICANPVNEPEIGFESDYNKLTVLYENRIHEFPVQHKNTLAKELLLLISKCFNEKYKT